MAVVVLHNGSQNPSLDYSAIYLANPRSATILVRGGDPSPDGNGVFEYFGYEGNFLEQVVLNDNGTVAFAAYLDQTSGGDDVDTSGIFVIDSSDTIHQVARTGQPLAGSTIFSSPLYLGSSFVFNGQNVLVDSHLRLAGVNAINDSGEIPFWTGLGDGSQTGLFVWGSPEIISLDMEDGTFGDWDASP